MRAVLPIWYLRSMLAGLALPVNADLPPDSGAEVSVFALPTRIDRIGRVLAPVKINDQGPFKFIVDTGASHSTISPRLAAALGLDPAEEVRMRVNGITGTADVPSVAVHKLQAGDLVIEETRLPVVWAPLMAGADGILGVAGLKEESIFVDFRRNRVTISRWRAGGTPRGFSRVAGQRLEGGLLIVPARIGGIRVQAIIDTGSERTIGNIALRDALKGWRRGAPLREVTQVYGATIDVAAGEMEVAPTIDLGSVRITDVTVVYGDFHIFEVWGIRSRPAVIIGMDVLGTVSALGIDFRRSELYLEGLQYVSGALRRPQPFAQCIHGAIRRMEIQAVRVPRQSEELQHPPGPELLIFDQRLVRNLQQRCRGKHRTPVIRQAQVLPVVLSQVVKIVRVGMQV